MRWPALWQALPLETRRAAWAVAVLTKELSRLPTLEEVDEVLHAPIETWTAKTVAHLERLAALGFAQESFGSWQVHPATLKLLSKGKWKTPVPDAALRDDLTFQMTIRGLDELLPWWYGDSVRVLQPEDDFSAILGVAGDAVVLREVSAPDESCFVLFATTGRGLKLQRWQEGPRQDGGTQLVAHLRLFPAALGRREPANG